MKSVSILGSTGSIGSSALRVIDSFPDKFKVKALSCSSNIKTLEEQIQKYSPEFAALGSIEPEIYDSIKKKYPRTIFFSGNSALSDIASEGADILLTSVVGYSGVIPTLKAIPKTKRIALANKETLVAAGDIVMNEAANHNTEIIPVDSEHSAIFSLLSEVKKDDLKRVIITASGGSLRDKTADELFSITPEEALRHPTWKMGSKITIDSATLMNKGFEVIEAHHLFNLPYDKIDVVIHPESVIHSMIETNDGSVFAHMGIADMALPIMNAFSHPAKLNNPFKFLDFSKLKSLSFREYDEKRFPALKICYEAGKRGGNVPCALNAAN
ncbi:MAG TPA: 1-deoxy-D-xylulose-5-phosphate reductoisomerase, partial [Spirochaetota bacterium]|nr:1-deoxy-D-xylulose-5-phosphate reductoisomerase [Spirochaetota bacterium]